MNTKKPLRESLKKMLEEDSLNEGEIAQLQMAHQATPVYVSASAPDHRFLIQRIASRANLAVASCLLVCLLIVGSFTPWKASDDLQQRLAQEVLTNHLKVKKLDLETSSMTDLRNHFDRLNFSPFNSILLDQSNWRLLGARYCTLQGVIALQYRLLTPEGEMVTYYQALYDDEHFGSLPDAKENQEPYVVNKQGFAMSMWKENGVVTVLARGYK
jgi:hypothetical protein